MRNNGFLKFVKDCIVKGFCLLVRKMCIRDRYKSASSRLLKKEFPEIREKLWKEAFWSQSFCLISTGGVTTDIIKAYIESQGEKNGVKKRVSV